MSMATVLRLCLRCDRLGLLRRLRGKITQNWPVDVLVNNAGITRDMTFRKMDKINWMRSYTPT